MEGMRGMECMEGREVCNVWKVERYEMYGR